jgi:hypothetical protein
VRPVFPLDGVTTGLQPTLVWKAHPNAAYYSVSVVSRQGFQTTGGDVDVAGAAYTCWVKSHIHGTSVKVTPDGFRAAPGASQESRAHGLLPNQCYMWMVFAYDRAGKLVSSSEHYRLDHEPIFIVRSDDPKGG